MLHHTPHSEKENEKTLLRSGWFQLNLNEDCKYTALEDFLNKGGELKAYINPENNLRRVELYLGDELKCIGRHYPLSKALVMVTGNLVYGLKDNLVSLDVNKGWTYGGLDSLLLQKGHYLYAKKVGDKIKLEVRVEGSEEVVLQTTKFSRFTDAYHYLDSLTSKNEWYP